MGRTILEKQKNNKPTRKLCTFVTDEKLSVTGGETILLGGAVVSLATSVGFGYTVGKTIVRGYLEANFWDKKDFKLEVFGERFAITLVESPVYDPENKALIA